MIGSSLSVSYKLDGLGTWVENLIGFIIICVFVEELWLMVTGWHMTVWGSNVIDEVGFTIYGFEIILIYIYIYIYNYNYLFLKTIIYSLHMKQQYS